MDVYIIYGVVNGVEVEIFDLDLYPDEEDNVSRPSPPGTPAIDNFLACGSEQHADQVNASQGILLSQEREVTIEVTSDVSSPLKQLIVASASIA
jgi:hypothetical protein